MFLAYKLLFFAPVNQPKVTEAIRTVRILKDDYNYDSTVRIFLLQSGLV
jgi:hypothetical protein